MVGSSQKSAAMLSCILSFALPVLLALYWPLTGMHFTWVGSAVRGSLLAITGLFAMLWWKAPVTNSERKWGGVLTAYLTLLVLNAIPAEQIARSLQNSLRILFLLVFCLILARAFRHLPTRRAFGVGALVSALLLSVYILGCYVTFLGTAMPTYVSTRIFKATVDRVLDVGLNPLGFSTAFFCMLAACTLRASWILSGTLCVVISICSIFTGSRTPLALMVVSFVLVLAIELCRSFPKLRFLCLGVLLPVLMLAGGFELRNGVDMKELSVVTENRTDLWTVAWTKFTERPLTGYGADSWGDDLIPRLPGFYRQTSVIVEHHSGGYHNAYFTLLAEEGIFIFGFAIFVLISAFRSVGAASGDTRQDRQRRVMLLFSLIFLVLRGFIEVPGWFGYGQDPAEFSCYAFLAIIISASCKARTPGRSPVRVSGVSPVVLSRTRFAQ